MYHECESCGAHLDPCEKCDCRQGIEKAASDGNPKAARENKASIMITENPSPVKPCPKNRCAACFWGVTDQLADRLCMQWESPRCGDWVGDDDGCDFWEGDAVIVYPTGKQRAQRLAQVRTYMANGAARQAERDEEINRTRRAALLARLRKRWEVRQHDLSI